MSTVDTVAFRDMLEGPKAFYNQEDYVEKTKKELVQKELPPVVYTWNTGDRTALVGLVATLAMTAALALVIYRKSPLGMRRTFLPASAAVGLAGYVSVGDLLGVADKKTKEIGAQLSAKLDEDGEWKYKRITVEVDGEKIDATIMGRASTLGNGRWVVANLGNVGNPVLERVLKEAQGNALFFMPSANPMTATKVQQVMLKFLEDQEQGIGAKEIIAYNYWVPHETLNPKIKYVFMQGPVRNISELGKKIFNYPGLGAKELSKKLQAPEIIMHTADVEKYEEIHDSSKLRDSERVRAKASLAKALLDDKECPRENKAFIGVPKEPKDVEQGPKFLAQMIERLLKK